MSLFQLVRPIISLKPIYVAFQYSVSFDKRLFSFGLFFKQNVREETIDETF